MGCGESKIDPEQAARESEAFDAREEKRAKQARKDKKKDYEPREIDAMRSNAKAAAKQKAENLKNATPARKMINYAKRDI